MWAGRICRICVCSDIIVRRATPIIYMYTDVRIIITLHDCCLAHVKRLGEKFALRPWHIYFGIYLYSWLGFGFGFFFFFVIYNTRVRKT